ncbi:MAG: hypothetical protein ACI9GZ_004635, partial [Bacteroidia bacterium]
VQYFKVSIAFYQYVRKRLFCIGVARTYRFFLARFNPFIVTK